MTYPYLNVMKADINRYLDDNYSVEEQIEHLEHRDEWESELYDDLWVEDSVTGNASGSYTFSRYTAKQYVVDNIELLRDMCNEFGIDYGTVGHKVIDEEWEYLDVSIRCYLLGAAISECLDELERWYNTILPKADED